MQPSKYNKLGFKSKFWNRIFLRSESAYVISNETASLTTKPWQEVPGPTSLPIIKQLHHFLPGGSLASMSITEQWKALYKKYGPIVKLDVYIGQPPSFLLFDAESSAQVLRGEKHAPERLGFKSLEYYRKKYKGQVSPDTISGLTVDKGETWRKFRSMVNPTLMQPKIINKYSVVLDEVALDMVKRLRNLRNKDDTIQGDFSSHMNIWALESVSSVALGTRLHAFNRDLPETSPEKQLIKCVHEFFVVAELLDFKPSIWTFVSTPTYRRAMKIYSEQERLTRLFVNKTLEKIKADGPKPQDEKGVLELLLDIGEELAVLMASDLLFAGVDTAANTIIGALYLLAINPEKQIKLREELKNQNNKDYLKACIKESMRIMPVAAGNSRVTSQEYNILGYRIPENSMILFGHQTMSMLEHYFKRPEEYLPERWLTDKTDPLHYTHGHAYAYSPFGYGVRSCVGRRIAELEMSLFLSRLIENFRVEWHGPPPEIKQSTINYVQGPFHFTFKDV